MFEVFPEWFQIFFQSLVPWWEGRYAMVYAIDTLGWVWWRALPVAVAGNMLPIPFILLFFSGVERFLRNFDFWANLMDKLFAVTRKRADKKIRRYEHAALLLFVAFPVPFTGAWTGALVAYLFDLSFVKSLVTIFVGVVSAVVIMTVITLTGVDILFIVIGVVIAGVIMGVMVVAGMFRSDE